MFDTWGPCIRLVQSLEPLLVPPGKNAVVVIAIAIGESEKSLKSDSCTLPYSTDSVQITFINFFYLPEKKRVL